MRNFVQGLESRTFLSVAPAPATSSPPKPDATITADLSAIKAAEAKLAAAWKADGPTIATDQKALSKAIQTATADVPSTLTTKLKTDQGTVKTDETDLFNAYKSKAPAATIKADQTALNTALAAVAADGKAIQTSINTNAGVVAAQATLKTALAPINADQAAVQAAIAKLLTDLKDHA